MALRASSLAAVTTLVWSTRLNPISMARWRTAWRAMTMCSEVVSGSVSADTDVIVAPGESDGPRQQFHTALDVQRRTHAGQRHAELDERNRHGRTHADDDRLSIEH